MRRLLIVLIGLYVAYAGLMIWIHPAFIYPFSDKVFARDGWTQEVVTERGVAVAYSQIEQDVTVLYFMGNGGAFALFTPAMETHENAGRGMYAMEYPGGGGIPGAPEEAALKADALALFDWVEARVPGPVVVHGFSMGTGLAVHVAANRNPDALVLDAPYTRMCDLMTRAAYLPACYLPGVQKWDSAADVPGITVPVLVQHGTADQLIPADLSVPLVAAMEAANVDVTYSRLPGVRHNTISSEPPYHKALEEFLARALN